jgi:two-component system, NarL family, sensor kinase
MENASSNSYTEEELLTRLEIQERSLKAFAREIYENIGQILSLAKLELGTLDLDDKIISEGKIDYSRKLIGEAISGLRNLVKQLSPDDIIKKGFADAIFFELVRLREAGICGADFRSEGDCYKLDATRELIIFGIIQGLICKLLTRGTIRELQIEVAYLPEEIIICTKFKTDEEDKQHLIKSMLEGNKFLPSAGITQDNLAIESDTEGGSIFLKIKKTQHDSSVS